MKKLFILPIIILCFSMINKTMAQRTCASSLNLQLIQKENPDLYNRLLQIESHTNKFIQSQSLKQATTASNVIRIPVVVHVLYNNSTQNISNAQVLSQIEVLNEDYRRLNADKSNTPIAFSSVASDIEVEFFFACIDPNGIVTNGITRTQTNITEFTYTFNSDGTTNETATRVKFGSLGGHDAWPTNRYLNIWVCNLNILGYSQFPGIGNANTDGVVVKYNCFGRTGTLQSAYNKGRTATHEIGHWLNLIHIWGDDDNNNGSCSSNECSGTDNITDTPNQGERNYGVPSFPKTDCCTSASPGVMFMNFMDYTDDAAMNLFTSVQKNRMRALFSTGGFRECFATNTILDKWCQSQIYYSDQTTVCSTGTIFTVTGVPGYTVTWNKSDNITFDNQPGNPKTFTANGTGAGWIEATIVSSTCGSITLPRKTVWAGNPNTPTAIIPFSSNGMEFGNDSYYDFHVNPQLGATGYTWVVGGGVITDGQGTNWITVKTNKITGSNNINFNVSVRAEGCAPSSYFVRTGWVVPGTGGATLLFTPNPAIGETTMTIETTSPEESVDPAVEWEMEVYSPAQNLKEKQTNLKGKSTKIQTAGWQEGVYVVRVKYNDEILTGKLVVKK